MSQNYNKSEENLRRRQADALPPRGRKKRRRPHKKSKNMRKIKLVVVASVALALVIAILWLAVLGFLSLFEEDKTDVESDVKLVSDVEFAGMTVECPKLDVQLLTVNPYSRPGRTLEKVNGVVIHYVSNPGTTAHQNRSYFEGLKDSQQTSASSHFIVGMEGEIVQCVPTAEIAFCSNERNFDTVSIEFCHEKEDGKPTQATYDSLVELTAFICCKYELSTDDIIRHYDVTEKMCPKYFVENEEKWEQFKQDVADYIMTNNTNKNK